jgi:peroxin-1
MPRVARIHYVSLKSSLVNLPISIFGPLVERRVRPQSLAVHLLLQSSASRNEKLETYVGWTGMASSSSLAHFRSGADGMETVEIDPQYATALGFSENDIVSFDASIMI